MRLSQLLAPLGLACTEDIEVTGLACDSRHVKPGMLFAALPGQHRRGEDYIAQAVERGACAVLRGEEGGAAGVGVPCITVKNPRRTLALLAAQWYQHPAQSLTLLAVTGTKGKTTTAHILRDILLEAGYRTGMVGTLGTFLGREQLAVPDNTTPEPITLQAQLRQLADAGCTHVVLEVSSQAMKQERLAGVTVDGALFLNLSPDHIGPGEHGSWEEYQACKARLFAQCRLAVGNGDDPSWSAMAKQIPPGVAQSTFGFGPGVSLRGSGVEPAGDGLSTRFSVSDCDAPYQVALPGQFNAANALAAVALCRAMGVEDGAIRGGLAGVKVPGRTQRVEGVEHPMVLIDYAHNGESVRALLSALSAYPHRRLIVVFGAGGDRPPMRRRDMALAVAEWADLAVVTEDNPRWERVEDICAHITAALGSRIPWRVEYNRERAIRLALDLAGPEDLVALLGKGHERYIECQGVRRPLWEEEVVREASEPLRTARMERSEE